MNDMETNLAREKVNFETSQIAWKELQRFFAAGITIYVDSKLDLVDVAYQFSIDHKVQVERWLQSGQIAKVSDQQALTWHETKAIVWAAVAKPWILVQP